MEIDYIIDKGSLPFLSNGIAYVYKMEDEISYVDAIIFSNGLFSNISIPVLKLNKRDIKKVKKIILLFIDASSFFNQIIEITDIKDNIIFDLKLKVKVKTIETCDEYKIVPINKINIVSNYEKLVYKNDDFAVIGKKKSKIYF